MQTTTSTCANCSGDIMHGKELIISIGCSKTRFTSYASFHKVCFDMMGGDCLFECVASPGWHPAVDQNNYLCVFTGSYPPGVSYSLGLAVCLQRIPITIKVRDLLDGTILDCFLMGLEAF